MNMRWNYWVIIGLAVWLLISPWVLGFSAYNLALWNNMLIGGFIIIIALWDFVPPEE